MPQESAGSSSAGPIQAYRARIRAGSLKPDPAQDLAAEKLQSLFRTLAGYKPQPAETLATGWFAKLLASTPPKPPARPKGLYIFGAVGRGKSMLMDLFFETAPVVARRRVHFHAFMQEVHDRLHRAAGVDDPMRHVAMAIAAEAWLLCFDEFTVTDIADAMVLSRLFESLFKQGVVIVATSNRAPDELYEGGLQRDRFLPFIAILKEEMDVLHLDSGRDYRLAKVIGRPAYYSPADEKATAALDALFLELTDGGPGQPTELHFKGRSLSVPVQAASVARFSFAELCEQPLGAADYLAVARAFDTVIIDGIPRLGPERRNEARRFNTLIDTLYEAKVQLLLSAEAPPEALYTEGDGAFEFQRTVSRLAEMQSVDYRRQRPRRASS